MFRERIIGVFKLKSDIFEEIGQDPDSVFYAGLIVTLVASLLALGNQISPVFGDFGRILNLLLTLAWTLVSWILWTSILFIAGRLFASKRSSYKQILSLTGFAYAPLALAILPWFGAIVGATWSLAISFVAIRQALGLNNRKTALIFVTGFIVYAVGAFYAAQLLDFII